VKRSLQNNIRTIYMMGFFHSFMVVIPVFVPLLQGYGLSMSQVLQTQALFALTIALCEVPSGYIADIWGRRNAVIVGSILNAFGFLSLLWADSFMDFVVYEIFLGVGFSLISGADLALLYDTEIYLKATGKGDGAGKSISRLISIEAAASGVAGIVAGVLLIWSLDWVVWVQAFTGFMPFMLGLLLVEPPRPTTRTAPRENARHIVALLLFDKPVVCWTILAISVFGLLAVYIFWIYQKYWELQGIPLGQFGYIWAAFALTVSLAARYTAPLEEKLGHKNLLILVAVLPLIGLFGMAFGQGWLGVMFGFAIQASRGISMTLFYEALNRRVSGEFRATVNSLASLGVRGIFIVTGPVLGYALDTQGMTNTLIGLIVIFTPLMCLVLVPLITQIRREPQDDTLETALAS
jgi:MFS family permease